MEKNTNKGMNLLQKLYRYRLKIDRKGTPIVNLSSLFCIPCLLFAPHMSIAGIILSLILGYHISLETEDDAGDLEQTVRNAAETVRKTAASAAKSIRAEVDKNRARNSASARPEETPAQPAETVVEPTEAAAPAVNADPAPAAAETPAAPVPGDIPVNQDLVNDLKAKEDAMFQANPAATTFHSAYASMAGSVPVLHVEEDSPAPDAGTAFRTDSST